MTHWPTSNSYCLTVFIHLNLFTKKHAWSASDSKYGNPHFCPQASHWRLHIDWQLQFNSQFIKTNLAGTCSSLARRLMVVMMMMMMLIWVSPSWAELWVFAESVLRRAALSSRSSQTEMQTSAPVSSESPQEWPAAYRTGASQLSGFVLNAVGTSAALNGATNMFASLCWLFISRNLSPGAWRSLQTRQHIQMSQEAFVLAE